MVSVVVGFVTICGFLLVVRYVTKDEPKKSSASAGEPSCKGLVLVSSSKFAVQRHEGADKIFVQVLLENKSTGDVSEPVIRADVFGKNGELIDTFVRTTYGANLPASSSAWFRVADVLAVDPSSVVSVKASVQRADCHGAWR